MSGLPALALVASVAWPQPTRESRPWVYNWWMGNAVDERGLVAQVDAFKAAGFGGFQVIPIYGVTGNEANEVKFHSPEGEEKLALAKRLATSRGLGLDASGAPGFTFGDSTLSSEEGMWRKGADGTPVPAKKNLKCSARKDAGYAIDPFSPASMAKFLCVWEAHETLPRALYHDSFDYHGAWCRDIGEASLPAAFAASRQAETFKVWTDWCREHGTLTRYQAHGSPGDWLELYALADIPECEVTGSINEKKLLMAKFASSAAHLAGRRLVSSETGTWLGNHFHVTLSDLKRQVDGLFVAGVNHVFYHGCCYSPEDEPWPGWVFYATTQMNPRNPIWRDLPALNAYVTRVQSVLQSAVVDNDLLLRWPVEDLWRAASTNGAPLELHATNGDGWFFSERVGQLALELKRRGAAFDYVSTRTAGLPGAKGRRQLVPAEDENLEGARLEPFDAASGLDYIRLVRGEQTIYFVVNLGTKTRSGTYALDAFRRGRRKVALMNAWTGDIVPGIVSDAGVELSLGPRESVFVLCEPGVPRHVTPSSKPAQVLAVDGPWVRKGIAGGPTLPSSVRGDVLGDWSVVHPTFAGTMRYAARVVVKSPSEGWLDLGDVRDSAYVRINGKAIGTVIQAPYRIRVPRGVLKKGRNLIEVDVTSVGANRIRDLDRRGVNWKHFNGNNVYAPNYKPLDASEWPLVPAGLFGPVKLEVR